MKSNSYQCDGLIGLLNGGDVCVCLYVKVGGGGAVER